MKMFTQPLNELKEYVDVKEKLKNGKLPVHISGCIDSQKCHLINGLGEDYLIKIIVTYSDLKAKEIYEDYKFFDKKVSIYPSKDVIFYSADIRGNLIIKQRLDVIKKLIEKEPITIITTIDAGIDNVLPLEMIEKSVISLKQGEQIDLEKLKLKLSNMGYERTGQVEAQGQFAIRGGIIDIFTLTDEVPYRIELWDNEIDSIRTFDIDSQRSIENINEAIIYPAAEVLLDKELIENGIYKIEEEKNKYVKTLRDDFKTEEAKRISNIIEEFKESIENFNNSLGLDSYVKYFFDNTISFFDYFKDKSTVVFIDEPSRITEKGEAVETEFREGMIGRLEKGYILPSQANIIYSFKEIYVKLSSMNTILLSTLDYKTSAFLVLDKYDFTVKSINPYNNNFEELVKDLKKWKKNGHRVILLTNSRTRARRLSDDLRNDYELNAYYCEDFEREAKPGEIITAYGNLHKGFEYPLTKLVVISESDIFGEKKQKKRKKVSYEGKKIQNFTDLNIGDYVVHENHGLGVYKGIEKIEVDKIAKDYIKIEYANDGTLYILATGLDVIQKYSSADAKKPKLNKLGSMDWHKTKTKVKSAVKDVAADLVKLYAIRQSREGYEFAPDTIWQREFEEMFPYDETDDQLKAIEATKSDMESKKIMDRLICGDVGYGKTEIAIRAAFKAVQDGKQVIYLVPTTILAQQHYNTFVQRMKDFPINISMLSRFRTPSEQKKTIEALKKGQMDIVIGTHRVLSSDIGFRNLGLLIVDEEQRFGVTHKEKIKNLKGDVDVLTLSATPIPRTLHMSLIGIRDMSVLEEPPVDRMPIQTYILEQNEEIIREAINRELSRGGQVYYVYNRVNNIDEIALMVSKLVPEANVSFAHGQMKERELEKIMFDFINGEIDVLVSTTIIETGLDISNVNTMIIHDADRLGLSQLYQLRGRVGRSNRTAYAFLMYKRDKMLKEIAEKRLQAIREFTELGSGFKIAMRDLEIRGAGNILGAQQHGHMEAVGYDLYCKMLNDAVKALKGEIDGDELYDTTVDIDIDAYIPATYVKSEYQKLDIYKRIASIENEEEYSDMQEELTDRFGEIPNTVINLLDIALIKAMAHKVYITQIEHKNKNLVLTLYNKAKLDVNKIPELVKEYDNKLKFSIKEIPHFIYEIGKNSKKEMPAVLKSVKKLLNDIKLLID